MDIKSKCKYTIKINQGEYNVLSRLVLNAYEDYESGVCERSTRYKEILTELITCFNPD